jgi:hypothetical protein
MKIGSILPDFFEYDAFGRVHEAYITSEAVSRNVDAS